MQALLPSPAIRANSKSDKMDGVEGADATADEETDAKADAGEDTKAVKTENGKSAKESKASSAAAEAKAANSKAATVESAIEYIRTLQQERAEMSEAIKAKDSEMNALRRKLRDAEFKRGSSNGASSTDEEERTAQSA